MSIADVSGRLSAILQMIDDARSSLNRAGDELDDAAAILKNTFVGTSSYEAERMLGLYADAQRDLRDQVAALGAAEQATRECLTRLVGHGATPPPLSGTDRSTLPDAPGSQRHDTVAGVSPERVEQL